MVPRFLSLPVRWVLGLLILLCVGGCQSQSRPNILLISIDACRADHLSSYGYGRETTPFIDSLAERGIRFENAFVNTHGTPSSHTTILSSLYQQSHRVSYNKLKGSAHHSIPDDVVLLQEILRKHGYLTLGVTGGGFMSGYLGFRRGFDYFDDTARGVESGTRKLVQLVRSHRGDERPMFALYHTYEVHSPYDPPEKFRQRFGKFDGSFETSSGTISKINRGVIQPSSEHLEFIRAMYDAGLAFTDHTLRTMFSQLDELGFFDNYLVLLTSDHGEELGERGRFGHHDLLYDELLRTPLIITGTGVPQGSIDQRLASSIDITPTILAFAGIEVDSQFEGTNLLRPPQKTRSEQAVYSQYKGKRYSIRTHEWKLILNMRPISAELYALTTDPAEKRNVAGEFPERVAQLSSSIRRWRNARARLPAGRTVAPQMTPEQRAQLNALGYLLE